ncbi:MAG: hypothetical protein H7343_05210 [Undibacterium sp.]|nr:hypothetical protein [Opitutaceae bacterium]
MLLGLNLRGSDGLETTRQFKAPPRAPKVIIVTLQDAGEYRFLALAAGADRLIDKAEFTAGHLELPSTH